MDKSEIRKKYHRGGHHRRCYPSSLGLGDEGSQHSGILTDCVTVIVRIRPRRRIERLQSCNSILRMLNSRTILFDPKPSDNSNNPDRIHYTRKRASRNLTFAFDYVYGPKSTNFEIFENSLKSVVRQILGGYSCAVLAYGATGSGKTFTMLGNDKQPGLIFLMAKELFRTIDELKEFQTELSVSYLEIYNETLKDLLQESDNSLSIREDTLSGVYVPNLTNHKPKDTSELLNLLSIGNSHRTQHPTDHNEESSRSHAIFEINVSLRKKLTTTTTMKKSHKIKFKTCISKLTMVDLAGSERGGGGISNTNNCTYNNHGGEGSNINKSLLALGNCINALAAAEGKKKQHIPYRDSKLTRILKDALNGKNKTIMITNLSPTHLNYEDSYNSLSYAQRAKDIKLKCKPNISVSSSSTSLMQQQQQQQRDQYESLMIHELEDEVASLKKLLQLEKDKQKQMVIKLDLEKVRNEKQQAMVEHNASSSGPTSNSIEIEATNTTTTTSTAKLAANANPSPSQTFPLSSISSLALNPINLELFMQLIAQKKNIEASFVETTIEAKKIEFKTKWIKWKIESIQALEQMILKSPSSSSAAAKAQISQEQIHLMKVNLDKLITELNQINSQTEDKQQSINSIKKLCNSNENELEQLKCNCLQDVKMNDPFLAVTFAEFLHYKHLEREVELTKATENFHQELNLLLLNEILKSEVKLFDAISLVQQQSLKKLESTDKENYLQIISRIFGDMNHDILNDESSGTAQQLKEFCTSPLLLAAEFQQSCPINDSSRSELQTQNLTTTSHPISHIPCPSSTSIPATTCLENQSQDDSLSIHSEFHAQQSRRYRQAIQNLRKQKKECQSESVTSLKSLYEKKKQKKIQMSQSKSAFGRTNKSTSNADIIGTNNNNNNRAKRSSKSRKSCSEIQLGIVGIPVQIVAANNTTPRKYDVNNIEEPEKVINNIKKKLKKRRKIPLKIKTSEATTDTDDENEVNNRRKTRWPFTPYKRRNDSNNNNNI